MDTLLDRLLYPNINKTLPSKAAVNRWTALLKSSSKPRDKEKVTKPNMPYRCFLTSQLDKSYQDPEIVTLGVE